MAQMWVSLVTYYNVIGSAGPGVFVPCPFVERMYSLCLAVVGSFWEGMVFVWGWRWGGWARQFFRLRFVAGARDPCCNVCP